MKFEDIKEKKKLFIELNDDDNISKVIRKVLKIHVKYDITLL